MGSIYVSWPIILVGNIIFGLGGEVLNVGQDILCFNWFHMANFNLSLNIVMGMNTFGTSLDQFLTPYVYERTESIPTCFFIALMFCLFSFICAIIACYMEYYAE